MNIKKDILWRVYVTFFLVMLMVGAIVVRMVDMQAYEGEKWRGMADSLTTTYVTIEPTRGNIYAADGSLMSTSLPIYDIRLDLNTEALTDEVFYNNIDSLSERLANYFEDKSAYQYKRLLIRKRKEGARYFLLKRNINHNQLKAIKKFPLFRRGQFKGGFIAKQKSKRIRPFGQLAQRTIGYKVKNVTGVGLEGAYNEYLSGQSGKRLMQKVRGGEWLPINEINELEPQDGKDIASTIDVNIQDVTQDALHESLKKHQANHGCAIVMDVKSGNVKAIANLEKNADGTYTENYNYAIGESLEPGSTFKLASALVLLKNNLLDPGDTLDAEDGTHDFYDRTMRDAKEDGYGKITFQRALEVSSNIAFSKAVFQNFSDNPKRYIKELKELHLNKPLNLPIAGEGKPVIKDPSDEDWSGTTLPWMAIGYELRLTPLQLLTLYNAVANDGKMVKPRLATKIKDVGKTIDEFDKEVIDNRIASQTNIQELKAMLKGVVEKGTAQNLNAKSYQIAGKTGTAQIAKDGGYTEGKTKYQASFVGFFPAEEPQYSCIVVVNNPTEGIYYGSWVAGPVFREISDKIYANNLKMHQPFAKKYNLSNQQLPPLKKAHMSDLKAICQMLDIAPSKNEELIEWANVKPADSTLRVSNMEIGKETTPDVRGMVLTDALYLLENRGLKVEVKGQGKVVYQSIRPGKPIGSKRQITIRLK